MAARETLWQTHTLSHGALTLVCLPGIGGRLWDIQLNECSLLFQNPDLLGKVPDLSRLEDLPSRAPQYGFPLWGGEKTWVAPDRSWVNGAPYRMLDSGPYHVTSNSPHQIKMQSACCPDSGLQVSRVITLDGNNSWSLHHSICNQSSKPREVGIWSVMMLRQPGTIALRVGGQGRTIAVFGDASHRISHFGDLAVMSCRDLHEYKIGARNRSGTVLMRIDTENQPIWMRCQTASYGEGTRFAHGHDFEVFNSGDYPYCEAEWHSSAQDLLPGQSLKFEQNFRVGNEKDLLCTPETSLEELELFLCMS